MRFLKWFLVFGLVTAIAVVAYVSIYLDTPLNAKIDTSIEGNIKYFEVNSGDSLVAISKKLYTEKLIQNPSLFRWIIKFSGHAGRVKVGEYELNAGMKPRDIMTVLYSGKSVGRPFTVTEGMNLFELADAYEEAGYGKSDDLLSAAFDGNFVQQMLSPILDASTLQKVESLEGYLFPETYQITKYMTSKEVLQAMVKRFQIVYQQILNQELGSAESEGNTRANSDANTISNDKNVSPMTFTENHLSPHQIITLASIIEKETGAAEERPLISSVFHNRLKLKMMLQTDPTIIYGIALETKEIPENISKEDIHRPTPYNTYTIYGLPPGPIANPSAEAIRAALKPESSEYLFFVSKNEGHHVFSKSYQDHVKSVQKFQLDPKSREGKSWRDLNH